MKFVCVTRFYEMNPTVRSALSFEILKIYSFALFQKISIFPRFYKDIIKIDNHKFFNESMQNMVH